ncbi:hypothetical protein NLN82_15840, partial [Citrobacter portucalensis]|nr:hypothetical protein [Citrobacter portucalensis]
VKCLMMLNFKGRRMFIAWYWIVLIALVAVGYYCHMKRYCRAFRQDRDALLEARNKLFRRSGEDNSAVKEQD